jgi:hypothetical protein
VLNVVLFVYARRVLVRILNASEEASAIFTQLDTFREHLQSVYELPTFYGDDTLSGLLKHTSELLKYLIQYDEVYSFTQPDLIEQLEAATQELEEEYGSKEATTQEKEE